MVQFFFAPGVSLKSPFYQNTHVSKCPCDFPQYPLQCINSVVLLDCTGSKKTFDVILNQFSYKLISLDLFILIKSLLSKYVHYF